MVSGENMRPRRLFSNVAYEPSRTLNLVCASHQLGSPCFRMTDDFSDAALVLAGHGSTLNADSAAPICQHADELRRRGIFAQVQEAFWKQEPYLAQVMRGVFAPRVFVVPLFISDGYFTEEVIPRELGFCRKGKPISPASNSAAVKLFFTAARWEPIPA